MKQREFIISENKLDSFDEYNFFTIKEKAEPVSEESKQFEIKLFGYYEEIEFYKQYVMGIYNGEFYKILFAQKGSRYTVYLVKDLNTHYTYRNVFGSKRHGTKRTGWEVFYHKDGTKEEMNNIYRELFKNIFKSKNGRYFTKITNF